MSNATEGKTTWLDFAKYNASATDSGLGNLHMLIASHVIIFTLLKLGMSKKCSSEISKSQGPPVLYFRNDFNPKCNGVATLAAFSFFPQSQAPINHKGPI